MRAAVVVLILALGTVNASGSSSSSSVVLQGFDESKLNYLDKPGNLDYYVPSLYSVLHQIPLATIDAHLLYIAVTPIEGQVCVRASYDNLTLANATSTEVLIGFQCGGHVVASSAAPFIIKADHGTEPFLFIEASAETKQVSFNLAWSLEDPGVYYDNAAFDHIWWTRSHDYVFLDRVLLIVLIGMAIFFEILHAIVHNCVKHFSTASFNMKLWNQVNAEFMVLGFIAFLVWVIERAGGLESLVHALHSTPDNAADMLHMIEDVHMRLFISMVLYFMVMSWIIFHSTRYMHRWARTEEDIQLGLVESKQKDYGRIQKEFVNLRGKFIKHIASEKLKDPIHQGVLTEKELKGFNFAAYLNKELEKVLMELVKISFTCWIATALANMTVALIIKYVVRLTTYGVFWTMCGIELCILGFLVGLTIFVEISYHRAHKGNTFAGGCIARMSVLANETVMARAIQIATFYGCYTLVYFATSSDARIYFQRDTATFYPGGPTDKAATLGPFLGVYIVVFIVINFVILPLVLPRFNVIFRTPPFFDDHERREVFRILYKQYHTAFFKNLFRKDEKKELLDHKTKLALYGHRTRHRTWQKVKNIVRTSSNSYSADDVERQLRGMGSGYSELGGLSITSSSMSGGSANSGEGNSDRGSLASQRGSQVQRASQVKSGSRSRSDSTAPSRG